MKKIVYRIVTLLCLSVFALQIAGCELLLPLYSSTGEGDTPPLFETEFIEVEVGAGKRLTVDTEEDIEWDCIDESVAEITAEGDVIGKKVGSTYAFAYFGQDNVCFEITVVENTSGQRYGYNLVFQDEFNGNAVDTNKWGFQTGTRDVYGDSTGPSNWGNNELQYYREENAKVANGVLTITAQKESEKVGGKSYTSSRLTTRGKFSFTYGIVEARIKCPAVAGMWPAFWMLPQPSTTQNSHNVYGGWARNGELDIMEIRGRLPNEVVTTLHFGDNYPQNQHKGKTTVMEKPITEWHTYGVEWRKESITWLVDGVAVFSMNNDQWWTKAVSSEVNPYAPYDQPFFLLLNLAVGGNFDPDGTTALKNNTAFTSAEMSVDYVRVYQEV